MLRLTEGAGIARDRFIERLFEAGIGCSVHYIPLHLHPYWRDRYDLKPGQFPQSQQAYERLFSLPIYTRMRDADVQRVIAAVKQALAGPRQGGRTRIESRHHRINASFDACAPTLEIDDEHTGQRPEELARRERSSAGSVLSRLARQALVGSGHVGARQRLAARRARAVGGFRPFESRGVVVSNDAVNALRDAEGV